MKNILLVFCEDRVLSSYPYIVNFVKLLVARNFKVTMLVNDLMLDKELNMENFEVVSVSKSAYYKKYFKGCLKYYIKNCFRFDFILYSGIEGLWLHLLILLFSPKKLYGGYISMEIFSFSQFLFPKWLRPIWTIFSFILKYFVKFAIIQDCDRAELLKTTLPQVRNSKIFLLPNSQIGFSNAHSTFAYDKFGIARNKKILLYSGALEDWAFDINLPRCMDDLFNKDYVLLLSGFSRDDFISKLYMKYQDLIESKKLIISDEILSEEEYNLLVRSSYIGLAWYKRLSSDFLDTIQGKNIYYMGLSSGKLLQYLSCGIPVIIPDYYYGFNDFINNSQSGIACSSEHSIVSAVLTLDNNMLKYKNNVEAYYVEFLEYSKNANIIIEYILNLVE